MQGPTRLLVGSRASDTLHVLKGHFFPRGPEGRCSQGTWLPLVAYRRAAAGTSPANTEKVPRTLKGRLTQHRVLSASGS